jgi:hypothetical protein
LGAGGDEFDPATAATIAKLCRSRSHGRFRRGCKNILPGFVNGLRIIFTCKKPRSARNGGVPTNWYRDMFSLQEVRAKMGSARLWRENVGKAAVAPVKCSNINV